MCSQCVTKHLAIQHLAAVSKGVEVTGAVNAHSSVIVVSFILLRPWQ